MCTLCTRFRTEQQEKPQDSEAAEMHSPGSLGCLPFDFWREHLFPILSNTKQESLQLACSGFPIVSSYESTKTFYQFQACHGAKILTELRDMDRTAGKDREIAKKFVVAICKETFE